MTRAGTLGLRVFRGASGLAELAPGWQALADSLPSATLNQYPQYYRSYVDAFDGDAKRCFALTAFRDDDLVAVIPVIETKRSIAGMGVRALRFPSVPMPIRDACFRPDVSFQDFLDCLVQSRSAPPWDYMHFRGVLATSPLVAQARYRAHTRRIEQRIGTSHSLDTSQADYVETRLNSKARNNLRRSLRKLAALGEYEFTTAESRTALESAFDKFLDTEAAGWKSVRGGKRAVKLHQDHTAFYRDLMDKEARRDRCHIHLLTLNGTAIASDFNILAADRCYSLKHGYDEQYSRVGPSNLLREYALERYCSDPSVNRVELISGASWHCTWRPLQTDVFDIKVFNGSMKGRLLFRVFKAKADKAAAG